MERADLLSANSDEHNAHLLATHSLSSDAEKEAHFIALVNGLTRPTPASRMQSLGSNSTNDLDEDGLLAGTEEEDSLATHQR